MEDLRPLAQGIHPSVLTDGGLVEAVAQRCDSIPIPVGLDVDGFDGVRLAQEIEGGAYFLVREASPTSSSTRQLVGHPRAVGPTTFGPPRIC